MFRGCREDTASGATKIRTKLRIAAARRSPNIQWEAVRASFNGLSISAGRATGGGGC